MKVKVSTFLKKYSETRNIHHTCGEEDEGFTSFHFFPLILLKAFHHQRLENPKRIFGMPA